MRRYLLCSLLFFLSMPCFSAKADTQDVSDTAPQESKEAVRVEFKPKLTVSIAAGSGIMGPIDVESSMGFQMRGSIWYGLVSIQTGGSKVDVDEAFAGLNLPSRFYLEMGLLKNDIGIEDFFAGRDRLFAVKSPARELAGELDYRSRGPGIRLYRDPKSDPLELLFSVHLPDGNVVPQTEIGAFFHFGDTRQGRLGVSASYLPLRTVDVLLGEAWQHDFYLTAGAADLSSPFRFLGEAAVGTVIERSPAMALLAGRPIPRWFLGADLQAGAAFPWDGGEFVPALRASFLMPAVDAPANSDLNFEMGGTIDFQDVFHVRADGGVKVALRGGTVAISLIWAVNGSLDLQ